MSRKRRWMLPTALALAGALVLGWLAIATIRDNFARYDAAAAGTERLRAADRACWAEMRRRDPEADAEADVRRGIRRPIFLVVGDDTRSIFAPGLNGCVSSWQHPPNPRGTPASCEGGLAGDHEAAFAYAIRYNRRLLRLAPRPVAAACQRASR